MEMHSQTLLTLEREHISIQECRAGFPCLPPDSSMTLSRCQTRDFLASKVHVGSLHHLEATTPICSFENLLLILLCPRKMEVIFFLPSPFAVCLVWEFLWIVSVSPIVCKPGV